MQQAADLGIDFLPRTTARILLRHLNVDDLPAFQAYRHDAEVGKYQGWGATPDDQARAFLARMNAAPAFVAGEWFQIGIADRQSNLLLGDIGVCLSTDGDSAEIGFSLARSCHGRGLAREALRELIALLFGVSSVSRIIAVTDARNAPAIKLLLALGMRQVETKEAIFRGEACDEHTFALARP